MEIKKIHHVAMAVKNLDDILRTFTDVFNLKVSKIIEIKENDLKVAFLDLGEVMLEVMQPTASDSALAKYIDDNGQGLHHLALEVDDIGNALKVSKEAGLKLQDQVPKAGGGGQIAYLSPETTNGVYLQFVQN